MDIIDSFFKDKNLDIRVKGNNPRFIDQKCTPDVICFIAECITFLNKETFTRNDIWNSKIFNDCAVLTFGKPKPSNPNAKNEYDKFISQPLDLLSYAGVLEKNSTTSFISFKILDKNILEFLSIRDRNVYLFLVAYFKKFFKDSGFDFIFKFLDNPTKKDFKLLKEKFIEFVMKYSKIGSRGSADGGKREISRMFPKALNPLALDKRTFGTEKGFLSKTHISYNKLVYNRDNFRDSDKFKEHTRKESTDSQSEQSEMENTNKYNERLMSKAIEIVRKLMGGGVGCNNKKPSMYRYIVS